MRATRGVLALFALLSCAHAPLRSARAPERRATQSNVLRSDYAGSAACAPCHPRETSAWARSPMHNMTRDLPGATVRAPFDGRAFRMKDDEVVLASRGGQRFMELSARGETHRYRLTRVIGGHHREDFVGTEEGGPELVMPVSYLIARDRLRYKGYSVMTRERPSLRAGPTWSETCIFCHNTEPYVLDLLGALRSGLKRGKAPVYQGELVDALLPESRRWTYRVTDEGALAASLGVEMERIGGANLHGHGEELLDLAISSTRAAFGGSDLIEVGIGCESCHNGARAHAEDPKLKPSLVPSAPFFAIDGAPREPERLRVAAENRACARCHQVLFTKYPHTWEGGARSSASPGGSHINSGEARDFLLGACASALACSRCHDPHSGDLRVTDESADALCSACHAGKDARAHTHHDPAREGARCVSCHMPRKNMSLDGGLSRYHRVASPTDAAKVLGDRPLECALCHPSDSIEALTAKMEAWWGKKYDRAILRSLYGALEEPAMRATLARGKPHEKAVALAVLGATKDPAQKALFEAELASEYPLVRGYAEDALTSLEAPTEPRPRAARLDPR